MIRKFGKRDEKLKEEIKIAKDIKLDEVSKLALISTSYPDDPNQTKEQKVLALIAKHNYVQKMVKSFREQNSDWESWIESIIDLWKEKKEIRTGGNAVKRKVDTMDIDGHSEAKTVKKPVEVKSTPIVPKKKVEVLKPKTVVEVNDSEDDQSDGESSGDDNNVSAIKEDNHDDVISGDDGNNQEDNVEEEVDDFFVGAVIKHKVIKRNVNQGIKDADTNHQQSFDGGQFNKSKRFKDIDSNQIPIGPKMKFKTMEQSKNFEPRGRNNYNFSGDHVQPPPQPSAASPSVHPSWQAKQKEKMLITSSMSKPNQSKHIKFDDGPMEQSMKFELKGRDNSNRSAEHIQPKLAKPQPPVPSPSVHPSWQAKQKEKMLIANSFKPNQSKHIKFDD